MLRKLFNKKGQNTAEYAIVIGLIVAAAIGMQTYVKRGLQGRVKDVVDHQAKAGDVGEETLTFSGKQYEPYYVSTEFETVKSSRDETKEMKTGGQVISTLTEGKGEHSERKGTQETKAFNTLDIANP